MHTFESLVASGCYPNFIRSGSQFLEGLFIITETSTNHQLFDYFVSQNTKHLSTEFDKKRRFSIDGEQSSVPIQ